jgi:hypothetical protein
MFSKAEARLQELDEAQSEAERVKQKMLFVKFTKTLTIFELLMNSITGLKNSLSGYKMHYTKMQMILPQ